MEAIITENRALTRQVWRMELRMEDPGITRPGQFLQLKLPEYYLRRPISVCDWDARSVTLVYKTVGEGTRAMTAYAPGMALDVLTGLGNGFDTALCGEYPLLVGGGVGLPPLIGLCRALMAEGKHPQIAAGFGTAEEVFLREDAERMGAPFHLATLDGSAGTRGLVTGLMGSLRFDSLCACGPEPMLRAVYDASDAPGQFSFEERMGCGFGACMGCSCKTVYGSKRICKDGPVLRREEILWPTSR